MVLRFLPLPLAAQSASVNLLAGKAEVQYNPDVTGPRHIIQAVQEAGFEAHLLSGNRCVKHVMQRSPLMPKHSFLG